MHNKTCTAIERDETPCSNYAHSKGYCQKHYERFRKTRTVDLPIKKPKQCIYPGCTATQGQPKIVITKNLCGKHYLRSLRNPDDTNVVPMKNASELLLEINKDINETHNYDRFLEVQMDVPKESATMTIQVLERLKFFNLGYRIALEKIRDLIEDNHIPDVTEMV